MLPPVLELYAVWHPGDVKGYEITEEFVEHFHGTAFTGLIGGAIEAFVRSEGWRSAEDAPRPIPCADTPLPNNIQQARFTVIVPLMGTEMAAAIESGSSINHRRVGGSGNQAESDTQNDELPPHRPRPDVDIPGAPDYQEPGPDDQ